MNVHDAAGHGGRAARPRTRVRVRAMLTLATAASTTLVLLPQATDSVAAVGALGVGTDFNADGYADLAVGIPNERLGSGQRGGAVQVLYGSSSGLNAFGSQLWSQNSPGIDGSAEDGDGFGLSVATGDFNGDGFTDLAASAESEDFIAGLENDGVVHVIYGSPSGLTSAGSQMWSQDNAGIPGLGESGDHFGSSLAAGDIDGDDRDELLIAAAGEDSSAGSVTVIYGTSAGLNPTGSQMWTLDSPGIPGDAEQSHSFGTGMAVGDFDGDLDGDLAVSWETTVPAGRCCFADGGGRVTVLLGTPDGITTSGAQVWSQSSAGIAGEPEPGDGFGRAMVTGDLDGSGQDELIVGARGDNPAAGGGGSVTVIKGSPAGLTGIGSQQWAPGSPGLDRGEYTAEFGRSLAVGQFGGTKDLDLAIGATEAQVSSIGDAGGVYVLIGSPSGLATAGNQFWSQDSPGIADQVEHFGLVDGEKFGQVVVGGNYDGSGFTDLAIGVKNEDVGVNEGEGDNQGAAHVIYGGRAALSADGNQFWMQGLDGLPGSAEEADVFSSDMG